MNQQTFEKAQELNVKIRDLQTAIDRVEKNEKSCTGGLPINLCFYFDEDYEDLKKNVLLYLKASQTKLKREFANLK